MNGDVNLAAIKNGSRNLQFEEEISDLEEENMGLTMLVYLSHPMKNIKIERFVCDSKMKYLVVLTTCASVPKEFLRLFCASLVVDIAKFEHSMIKKRKDLKEEKRKPDLFKPTKSVVNLALLFEMFFL